MSLTGGIVLFAVIWFLVFFIVLQATAHSQEDAGAVEPGTPPGAPSDARIGRKARLTTVIAAVVWAIVAGVLLSGAVTLRDIDWFGRMGPSAPSN